MRSLFFVPLFVTLISLPVGAIHVRNNRHLDDLESSGTVLDENMDDSIQAEEEEEAEEERAVRREREIQQDDKRNPANTRMNRGYIP